jgi:hypothetical protein
MTTGDRRKTANMGKRPWLSAEGLEIANREARYIALHAPEQCDDAEDVSLTEVLQFLERPNSSLVDSERAGEPDAQLLTEILQEGVPPTDAVRWYLYAHGGLGIMDIVRVEQGRDKLTGGAPDDESGNDATANRQHARNVQCSLKTAAQELGEEEAVEGLTLDA